METTGNFLENCWLEDWFLQFSHQVMKWCSIPQGSWALPARLGIRITTGINMMFPPTHIAFCPDSPKFYHFSGSGSHLPDNCFGISLFPISHETKGMSRNSCVQQIRSISNTEISNFFKKCFCLVTDASWKVVWEQTICARSMTKDIQSDRMRHRTCEGRLRAVRVFSLRQRWLW